MSLKEEKIREFTERIMMEGLSYKDTKTQKKEIEKYFTVLSNQIERHTIEKFKDFLFENFDVHIHDSSVIQGSFDEKFENMDDFCEKIVEKYLEE